MHRSRIATVSIDCRTGDLSEAIAFWSSALGAEARPGADGRHASFEGLAGPRVDIQAVDHDPRVHLDLETDDREAECRRLTALGAREVARIADWIVMEAPTGHRFCLIKPQGDDFPGDAPRWEVSS